MKRTPHAPIAPLMTAHTQAPSPEQTPLAIPVKIPADVANRPDLTLLEKFCLGEVLTLHEAYGDVWASDPHFEKRFGANRDSCNRAVNSLQTKGFVKLHTDESRGNRRRIEPLGREAWPTIVRVMKPAKAKKAKASGKLPEPQPEPQPVPALPPSDNLPEPPQPTPTPTLPTICRNPSDNLPEPSDNLPDRIELLKGKQNGVGSLRASEELSEKKMGAAAQPTPPSPPAPHPPSPPAPQPELEAQAQPEPELQAYHSESHQQLRAAADPVAVLLKISVGRGGQLYGWIYRCMTDLRSAGELDHFLQQFHAYREYKQLTQEWTHQTVKSFLGDPDRNWKGAGWREADWVEKLAEYHKIKQAPQPQAPTHGNRPQHRTGSSATTAGRYSAPRRDFSNDRKPGTRPE